MMQERMIPDAELLRRYARERSEEAFAELVRRRIDLVYSVARRQVGGDTQLAEDVTQKVFTDLARKAEPLSQRAVLTGWLYQSARFAASDAVRVERSRKRREQAMFELQEKFDESSAAADWEKVRPVLDEVLASLSETDRDAMALRFFEDASFAEVGQKLALSEEAARKRVDRALGKVRDDLKRRGIESTAAALMLAFGGQLASAAPAELAAAAVTTALQATPSVISLSIFTMTTKSALTLATAVLLAAVGLNIYEAYRTSFYRSEFVAAEKSREEAMGRWQKAEARLAAMSDGSRATVKRLPGSESSGGKTSAPAPLIPPFSVAFNIKDFPELQTLYHKKDLADARVNFAQLYRQLNWSADRMAEFEQRYAESVATKRDLDEEARLHGMVTISKDVRALMAQADDSLKEFLGESDFNAYNVYRAQQSQRVAVDSLAGQMDFTATPLTEEIRAKLMDLFVANSSPTKLNQKSDPVAATIQWEAVLNQAQGLLAPAQIETLHALSEQDVADQKMKRFISVVVEQKMKDQRAKSSAP